MQKTIRKTLVMLLLVCFGFTLKAEKDVRLLRFPDINKDLVALTHGFNQWKNA